MSFKEELLKIQEKSQPISNFEIFYRGALRKMDVYEIDINLLRFNYLNGRIGSEALEYEQTKGRNLRDLPHSEANKIISNWIWEKSKVSNEKTYKDLKLKGQIEPGIVTSDGIIVDGNRRFMIINKIVQDEGINKTFKAAILSETYDGANDELGIIKLETQIQLGSDEKVGYTPIEKYIRVLDFIDKYVSNKRMNKEEVRELLNKKKTSEIDEIYLIGSYMKDYLKHINASNVWSRLENSEDLFINLAKTHSLYEKEKGNAGWNFTKDDVHDYKMVGFELIRFIYNYGEKNKKFNPKTLREYFFKNSRDKTIFSNKRIWENFRDTVFNAVDKVDLPDVNQIENDEEISYSKASKKVDELYANQVSDDFKNALGRSISKIEDKETENEPEKFIRASLDKLENLIDEDKFNSDKTIEFNQQIIQNILKSEEKEDVLNLVKDINKISYHLKRELE